MTAFGDNLLGVQIDSAVPEIIVGGVNSTKTQASFVITATSNANVGNVDLTFTTSIGSVIKNIYVAEKVPELLTEPNPLAVQPNNQVTKVKLLLAEPLEEDLTYDISITDTTIATVAQTTATFLQGETSVEIDITGLVNGETEFQANVAERFFLNSFPLFVTDKFTGDGENFARPVGVIVGTDDPTGTNVNLPNASVVGVIVGTDDPTGANVNLPNSSVVGVIVGTDDPTGANVNLPNASVVGVIVGTDDPSGQSVNNPLAPVIGINVGGDTNNNPLVTGVGTIVGPLLNMLSPTTVFVDDISTITILGYNLQDVVTVSITPIDDLILGGLTINSSGTEVSLPITVDAAASTGIRTITVSTPSGMIDVLNGLPLELDIQ